MKGDISCKLNYLSPQKKKRMKQSKYWQAKWIKKDTKKFKMQTYKAENKVDFPFPSANIAKCPDLLVQIVLQLKLYVFSQ